MGARQVALAWKSYFAACAAWEADPTRFLGHPKLPKYLDKQGRNLLTYTEQAISRAPKNRGYVIPSGLDIRVETRQTAIDQVRIVPHASHYTVEVIYERPVTPADIDPTRVAAIDIGLNNLAAVTANQPGIVPLLVNGRPLKAINQWYNKRRAQLQAKLPAGVFVSRQLDILADKRARQITGYLHVASRRVVDWLVGQRIGTLIIGKNDGWKQAIGLGKRTNQNFVFVPHARFIEMLQLQGGVGRHPGADHRGELHQSGAVSSMVIRCLSTILPSRPRLQWAASQARTVSRRGWAAHQRGCEWRVQYPAQSSPERLWQRDRGCGSSPRQDYPGEWATWQQCPCRLELYSEQSADWRIAFAGNGRRASG